MTGEEFARAFTEAWAEPTPERLVALLHHEVRLVAPLTRSTVGANEARREFERLFALIPDLRGRVHRWSATDDVVFIEFSLSGTFGGKSLEWRLVDRFLLSDGQAVERVSYFDPIPLIATVLRRPSGWPAWVRSVTTAAR
jgi:hypothetical protein